MSDALRGASLIVVKRTSLKPGMIPLQTRDDSMLNFSQKKIITSSSVLDGVLLP